MEVIEKKAISPRFAKSINTYNQHAQVQKSAAHKLYKNIQLKGKVLEIGCGTGFLSQLLIDSPNIDKLYLNDISLDLLQSTQNKIQKSKVKLYPLPGNAENIALPGNLDAIVSASTFQWFNNFDTFLEKAAKTLKPGGVLAFTSFGPQNFKEIRKILGIGLDYLTPEEYKIKLSKYFRIEYSLEWTTQQYFKNGLEVLKHMKYTGVNAFTEGYFGKEKLKRFDADYKHIFAVEGKYPLTYQPLVFVARM